MRVAFVASNPSHLGPDSPAKQNLFKWIKSMELDKTYSFFNVSNSVTPDNRPLKKSEYELDRLREDLIGCSRVVALGNTASEALERLNISHFKLPHPSPRNRVLNDQILINSLLQDCRLYLED